MDKIKHKQQKNQNKCRRIRWNYWGNIIGKPIQEPNIVQSPASLTIATIWSAAMMMEHLGQPEAAELIMKAIEIVLKEKIAHTPDMGGKANTKECGDAVVDVLKDLIK